MHKPCAICAHIDPFILVNAPDTEAERELIGHPRGVDRLRDSITNAARGNDWDAARAAGCVAPSIPSGMSAGELGLLGHVIDEVVDVQDVAAGEHPGDARLKRLVDHGPSRDGRELDARAARKLVLGKKPHREEQGIAWVTDLGPGNRAPRPVDLGEHDRLDALLALDARDGMAEQQRDTEVVDALDDVALEAARIRHELGDARDVGSLERHATGHDEPDVAGAEDDDLAARHEPLDVHEPLRGARGIDARGAEPRDAEGAGGALAAPHGEHDGARTNPLEPTRGGDAGDGTVCREVDHHAPELNLDAGVVGQALKAVGVLGAGQLLFERDKPEPVVDALVEDAAELLVALDDEDLAGAGRARGGGSGETRGASADDDHVIIEVARHGSLPFLRVRAGGPEAELRAGAHLCDGCLLEVGNLAREDLHDLRRAEPGLAAAHASLSAPLYGVETPRAERRPDRVDNLPLGDAAAPADDAPVIGALGDQARPLVEIHVLDVGDALAARLPVRLRRGVDQKPRDDVRDHAPDVLFTVLMRRSMLRIANQVAKKLELQALITGESLAQVASQTMAALACTDQAQDLPVLRPCIGMDKIEIINISRKIGTFETSIEPYEDCCTIFTPPHPKTNPTLDEILAAEAAMPGLAALEAEAAENVEKIYIRMGDDELL